TSRAHAGTRNVRRKRSSRPSCRPSPSAISATTGRGSRSSGRRTAPRRRARWPVSRGPTRRGAATRYVLPLQIEWVRFDRERYNPRALAAVRQGAREGTLLDVATDQIFIALLLRNLRESP